MDEDSDPQVLEYGRPANRSSAQAITTSIGAVVFTVMGMFGELLLMDGAWKIAAICSAVGAILALVSLKMQISPPRRIVNICIATMAAAVFVLALMDRR